MKTWAKIKEFYRRHDVEVWIIGGMTLGIISSVVIYRTGYNNAVRNGQIGLNACILVNPELKPMLEDAVQKVEKTIK